MRRLYFLIPTVKSAQQLVDELLLARVEERRIHLVAKDHAALELAHLPEANLLQESDFLPAIERGLAVGGATGIVAGIAAVTFPPAGLVVGGGAILGISLLGAGFGAWVAGMIGISVANRQISQFETAIAEGSVLMMVDVPREKVEPITELVQGHHPEAEVGGTEPTIPPFP